MRDNTERPEGIAAGTCRLVGTDPEKILQEADLLLGDEPEYHRRSALKNPYGDGLAPQRLVDACWGVSVPSNGDNSGIALKHFIGRSSY